MRLTRSSLQALALALLLVAASVHMAVARVATGPVGHMVLCTGQGVVTVLIDADGQPTGAVHICPDCAMAALADLPEPLGALHRVAVRIPHIQQVAYRGDPAHITPIPPARGPPVLL